MRNSAQIGMQREQPLAHALIFHGQILAEVFFFILRRDANSRFGWDECKILIELNLER